MDPLERGSTVFSFVSPKYYPWIASVLTLTASSPFTLRLHFSQDSALIKKLSTVLTGRIIKFLGDKAKKHPEEYKKFYEDYGFFIRFVD